jgi:glucose/arabinose dehydrogenase
MKPPLFHSGNSTWAPAGISLRDNVIYVATLRGKKLLAFNLKDSSISTIFTNVGRMRDVLIAGNDVFIVTSNTDGRGTPARSDDRLIKIEDLF